MASAGARAGDTAILSLPSDLDPVLGPMLPDPCQTRLLQAMFLPGERGRAAWHAWEAEVGGLSTACAAGGGLKRLLPLLYTRLRDQGVALDRQSITLLRTAYARETLRGATYRRICVQSLSALNAHGVPVLLLKGAALVEPFYGDWALRHCHDIDMLVAAADLPRAVHALRGAGFTEPAAAPDSDIRLRHQSGLPVVLHTRLFDHPYYTAPFQDLWARRRSTSIDGREASTLSAADTLLHLCTHASYSSSRTLLRWACDAWYLIAREPALDWEHLARAARQMHAELPLLVGLRYLGTQLGAPVPTATVRRLRGRTSLLNIAGYHAALHGLRVGARQSMGHAFRRDTAWRARLIFLSWSLFPAPSCVPSLSERAGWYSLIWYPRRLARGFRRLSGGGAHV